MAASLADAGHPGVTVVDVPMLRNLELFPGDDGPDAEAWAGLAPPVAYAEWQEWFEPAERQCLVAASDFGGLSLLRDWNRFCLENETHFFPVVLQDLLGWVGPLVIPGETPCFECFLARRASHLAAPGVARAAELAAYAGQAVASFHPAAAGMLGELAAMELLKLYGGRLPGWRAGQVLELQVLVPALAARPVLRVPRCPACSGLNARSSAAADRFVLDAPSLDA
jgi:bacteriocin biosynthesis cyclodehydratase domain-containing protein